jgi:hypothetical protein
VVGAVLALVGGRLQGNVRAVREETAEPLERLHRLLGRLAGQFDDEEDDDNDDDPRRGGEPRSGAMLAQPPQLISPTQRV